MIPQLPLDLQLAPELTFDSFIASENVALVQRLREMVEMPGQRICMFGVNGVGKTHLLQACIHQANLQKLSAIYFPAEQILQYDVSVLEGLENMQVVALDDIHLFAGHAQWEQGLFDLFNRLFDENRSFVFSSTVTVNELPIKLPDLKSRLAGMELHRVKGLDDDGKKSFLTQRASELGMQMSDEVASYLISRIPRDINQLTHLLDQLNEQSLAEQRKLTIPFVKKIIGL